MQTDDSGIVCASCEEVGAEFPVGVSDAVDAAITIARQFPVKWNVHREESAQRSQRVILRDCEDPEVPPTRTRPVGSAPKVRYAEVPAVLNRYGEAPPEQIYVAQATAEPGRQLILRDLQHSRSLWASSNIAVLLPKATTSRFLAKWDSILSDRQAELPIVCRVADCICDQVLRTLFV